ncbi:PREDICTED: putative F-box protein At2g11200 [Camelina sativa]|uniref:F-box protein At2g11200 n=1 Tax=Camelina sativa TaxID=90675 RepID=A0ABM0WAU0_CAMSA|nr:PREDICTED: putative F-box protein At2g11200 [Camelina sativa]
MKDSTTALSDLPLDLVEEVISKVPLTSLRAVRTTCKNWNGLFKHRRSFTKKHIRKTRAATKKREFRAIMRISASVDLMSFNLRGLDNDEDVETFINRKGKFINLNDGDGVDDIYSVSHCSDLLLCTTGKKKFEAYGFEPLSWANKVDRTD